MSIQPLTHVPEDDTAEQKLQLSEARYRRIVEDQIELICRYTPDMNLTFVNPAYAEFFGQQPEAMIGKNILDMISSENHEQAMGFVHTLTRDNPIIITSHPTLRADGSTRWTEWTDRAIFDDDGVLREYQGIGRDITDRKRMENALIASEEKYRTLVESLDASILLVNMNGEILFANSQISRGLQTTADDLLGKHVIDVFPRSIAMSYFSNIQAVIHTGMAQVDEIRAPSNGEEHWYRVSFQPVKNETGLVDAVLLNAVDISDAKRIEATLIAAHNTLDERVNERTIALDVAINQLARKLEEEREMREYLKALHEINLEVAQIDSLDTFYRRVVELGRERLGMDRMGFFLHNPNDDTAIGTYGTDVNGHTQAESDTRFTPAVDGLMLSALEQPNHLSYRASCNLEDKHITVGEGWNLAVALWHVDRNLGWLVADNLIHQHLPTHAQLEIMAQYGIYVSAMLARLQSEAERQASENRYRLLAENVTDMISRHSPDGNFTYVTPSSKTIVGYTSEELIGHSAYEYFHPEDVINVQSSHQAILELPLVYTVAYRSRHKQGYYIWLETTSHIIKDPHSGEDVEIIAVSRNITERKAAEAALQVVSQRLELATQAGGVGIWDWDILNDTLIWDERMLALYGLTALQCSNTAATWSGALHPEDTERTTAELNAAIAGDGHLELEFRIVWRDGTVKHIRAIGLVMWDQQGQAARILGVNIDITERKKSEAKLLAALEKEKEVSDLKSRFVSMASHEFRTPLTTIMSTAETLIQYRAKMNDAQMDQRLGKIITQVNYMKEMMEDILHLARLQAGKSLDFKPLPTDLNALCLEVIEEFYSEARHQDRIHYSSDPPPVMAVIDGRLMHQVVSNLVANALKYSTQTVSLELEKEETNIILTIRDHGIGIPENDLKHLFEPFHRAENVGAREGTGLGLSIAKQAVETHGGKITVESEVNKGSVFTIFIPLPTNEVLVP